MINEYIGFLLHSSTQTRVYHLQTSSYAKHKALNKYYDKILDLVDTLAEAYQGKYGIIKDIKVPGSVDNIKTDEDIVKYFGTLSNYVDNKVKDLPEDTYLRNICDEIATLIYQTTYLLKNLD
jgi:hypothetical protein